MDDVAATTPRVSVVVPAFRNARFLAATIDSILAQTYDDYELVIADHSSDDGSDALLARYRAHPKVRVLSPTPPGGGAVANWNRVSSHARGEFLKLVCGDDLIWPCALQKQVAAFDEHPSAVLVCSRRDLVDANGRRIIAARGLGRLHGHVQGAEAARAAVRAGTNLFGEPGSVLFRKRLLDALGGWDNRFPYLIDQATYTRIMLRGDVVALREPMASFRLNAGQWTVRLMKEQASQAIGFHHALAEEHPGLVSASDLRIGNMRAIQMAIGRRLAYMWLSRRL